MKFGHEYQTALANEGFPPEWVESAIEYKHLKKVIKKVHRELERLGLNGRMLENLRQFIVVDVDESTAAPEPETTTQKDSEIQSRDTALHAIPEHFSPQVRVLVDSDTGAPIDATLSDETRASLRKLVQHEILVADRRKDLGAEDASDNNGDSATGRPLGWRNESVASDPGEVPRSTRWINVPLTSAQDFFDMLQPKLEELESLRDVETHNLEEEILDLGSAVENVVEPVREGFEATRRVSYRDLYFWREMFRLYLEKPIFYAGTERKRGALTFAEARDNLQEYDTKLRNTGLLAKMKTPAAKAAAQQFLNVNLHILKTMHFQEMNSRAMRKILKKFDKQTHLEGRLFLQGLRTKYPALLSTSKAGPGGFANSIARDLQAEMVSKVLAIVPQLDDWICPVCYSMAWRPVNLGCCRSVFCITCVIKLQDEGMARCPMCNADSVMKADGRNIDFETMDFLEKYFPLEVKTRQKENEKASLARDYGEEFVKPSCAIM